MLSEAGSGRQASLPGAPHLSSVAATSTTCLAFPSDFILLCLASVSQVLHSYSQRPAQALLTRVCFAWERAAFVSRSSYHRKPVLSTTP